MTLPHTRVIRELLNITNSFIFNNIYTLAIYKLGIISWKELRSSHVILNVRIKFPLNSNLCFAFHPRFEEFSKSSHRGLTC